MTMDPVSNADRLVRILRHRLDQRSRASGRGAPSAPSAQSSRSGGVQPLAAVADIDDRQMRRSLIQGILTDQFGTDLLNDAKFQHVIDQVIETLGENEQGARLLDRMVGELRAAAR